MTVERRAAADQITNAKHPLAGKWRGVVRERAAFDVGGWTTWDSVWRSSQAYAGKDAAVAAAQEWMNANAT